MLKRHPIFRQRGEKPPAGKTGMLQSALMLAAFTTFPHFSASAFITAPNFSGVPGVMSAHPATH